jgi:hypothetical protein
MSTRATYLFEPGPNDLFPKTCIYIHWDGYPEGAANYFYDSLMHAHQRGGWPNVFLRANDAAELTTSHDAHGDTEYRYTLSGEGDVLTCQKREGDATESWPTQWSGPVHEFVNEHAEDIEDYEPFQLVHTGCGRSDMLNITLAKRLLYTKEYGPLLNLRTWSGFRKNHPPMGTTEGNWQACAKHVEAIVEAFPELLTLETRLVCDTLKEPVSV